MIRAGLLTSSICLSSGRSILSKKLNNKEGNNFTFFLLQTLLFLICLLVVVLSNLKSFYTISLLTLIYGIIYGLLLVSAQWLYTIALKSGPASTCSMIYSFGFIIPTICSFIFWNEQINLLKILGISLAITVILLISLSKESKKKNNKFIIPLLLSTLSSGGLGVLQKIQQKSSIATEKGGFLFIAFCIAFMFSLIFTLINAKRKSKVNTNQILFSILCGLCFGLANIVNTTLAGLVPGSILFPIQNIGVILLVSLLGIIIFKEKPSKNEILAFFLGFFSIILLSL